MLFSDFFFVNYKNLLVKLETSSTHTTRSLRDDNLKYNKSRNFNKKLCFGFDGL